MVFNTFTNGFRIMEAASSILKTFVFNFKLFYLAELRKKCTKIIQSSAKKKIEDKVFQETRSSFQYPKTVDKNIDNSGPWEL